MPTKILKVEIKVKYLTQLRSCMSLSHTKMNAPALVTKDGSWLGSEKFGQTPTNRHYGT